MLKGFRPNYQPPGRHALTNTHAPKILEETKGVIKNLLKQGTSYNITADGWTATEAMPKKEFVTVTIHFLTKNFQFISACLDCGEFVADSHTAENIADFITEVLDQWQIPLNAISAGSSDNGSNVAKAMELLHINFIPCFGHTSNVGVNKFFAHPIIKEILTKCLRLRFFVSTSTKAELALASSLKEAGMAMLTLPSVCDTRWWSKTRLLRGVVKQHEHIVKVVHGHDKGAKYLNDLLTPKEIIVSECVLKMLQPLEEISEHLAGQNYVTASAILSLLPRIRKLLQKIEINEPNNESSMVAQEQVVEVEEPMETNPSAVDEYEESPEITTEKPFSIKEHLIECIMSALEARYDPPADMKKKKDGSLTVAEKRGLKTRNFLAKCAFMDPRFRGRLREDLLEDARYAILGEMLMLENSATPEEGIEPKRKKNKKGFSKIFGSDDEEEEEMPSSEELARAELHRYESMQKLHTDEDVLKFWAEKRTTLPRLAKLAEKYLAAQATSVSSERVFSCGGNILSEDRSVLTGSHARDLIFLAINKRFVPVPQ
ncbi:unnamed protein product [Bemisia tabaci]|uniref:HAT C-terminal dimerisation domain-containing protein n=2 Tax=Bemisia tabaci TaxID=7038 RepID=A0A9P0F444_BEMTA|nr:unnamed protein product [Bemisia tabaci]